MWPLLAAGLLKYGMDKNHEDKDRQLAATKEMSSNFTGEHGAPVTRANLMGDLMSGGVAGMQMDQASANAAQSGKLSDAMAGYYGRSGASPQGWAAMPSGQGASLFNDPNALQYGKPASFGNWQGA